MITIENFLKGLDDELNIAPQRSSYKPEQWEMRDLLNAMYRIGRTMTPDFVFDDQNIDTYRQLGFWFMNDSRMTAFNPNGKGRTARQGNLSRWQHRHGQDNGIQHPPFSLSEEPVQMPQ